MAKNENLNVQKEYEFTDHQPFQTTYYRISQIDIDGQTDFYKTYKSEPNESGGSYYTQCIRCLY